MALHGSYMVCVSREGFVEFVEPSLLAYMDVIVPKSHELAKVFKQFTYLLKLNLSI